ncbi:MAG TPA: GNAT family N-acetyltransferase [Alphaproteobacteria bacterium]|nr:GNAT family N-acetyltransferase [Alphaproteobacteria bacterium]HAJ46967.1 GNAT family N-acetyltransferase [Alphaproteobacteria bacterium]
MQAIPITITFLEMRRRPHAKPLALPHGADGGTHMLLRAHEPPLRFYRYLYDAVGHPYHWVARKRWADAELAAAVHDPKVEISVLYARGIPAGFFELDFRKSGECDLAYFGLTPDFTGRRLGPFMLSAAIDAAWSREIERMTVNTNTLDHPRALPLYQRMGFSPYAQARDEIVPISLGEGFGPWNP